jgi:hypothetical protein
MRHNPSGNNAAQRERKSAAFSALLASRKTLRLPRKPLGVESEKWAAALLDNTKAAVIVPRIYGRRKNARYTPINFAGRSRIEVFVKSDYTRKKIRVSEVYSILKILMQWSGDGQEAVNWYLNYPIPAFGGRTASSLVREGRAADVRSYLDHVAAGGFA